MSELEHVLELFGFMSLEDITVESLKSAFKSRILKAHPDKGGDAQLFDDILHSYVYLSETVQRVSGGRATLQNIVSPDELKGARVDELISRLFEEFERETFNQTFEEQNKKDIHGYNNWFKNREDEDNLMEGVFGDATQKAPTFEEKDFHKIFETKVKEGKPQPTAIILHPEAMAYISGQNIGTDIIESTQGGYTSQLFTTPEFTDAHEAFSNLTIYDKIPEYSPTNKSLEDLIAERNKEIIPFNNNELKAIQDFEKKKLEKSNQHYSKIKEHFEYDDKYQTNLINWPPEKYSDEAYKGFRMDF